MSTAIPSPINPNDVWVRHLGKIIHYGSMRTARDQETLDLANVTLKFDSKYPVITIPQRALAYRYAAAESLWMLEGRNDLASLTPYNANIHKFSDDGVTLAGAYGPKIVDQLEYVVKSLVQDKYTRQAGLTIWERNPEPSKDIPCTIALWFTMKEGWLNMTVMMRSSDTWLGLPYDLFAFSMILHRVTYLYNQTQALRESQYVIPGFITFHLVSSHLYDRDMDKAYTLAKTVTQEDVQLPGITPPLFYQPTYNGVMVASGIVQMTYLKEIINGPVDCEFRWWKTT